jgi:hypothetical protein
MEKRYETSIYQAPKFIPCVKCALWTLEEIAIAWEVSGRSGWDNAPSRLFFMENNQEWRVSLAYGIQARIHEVPQSKSVFRRTLCGNVFKGESFESGE